MMIMSTLKLIMVRSDDKQFALLYKYYNQQMNNKQCDAAKCQHIIHHHRDRWKEYEIESLQNDNKIKLMNDLCSRAHCYIAHGYQLYRLNDDELKQIENQLLKEEKNMIMMMN